MSGTFSRLVYVQAVRTIGLCASKCDGGPRCFVSVSQVATFDRFRLRSFRVLVGSGCVFFTVYLFCLILRIVSFNATVCGFVVYVIISFLLFCMFVRRIICVRHAVNCHLVRLYRCLVSRSLSRTRRYALVMFRLPILGFAFRYFFNGIVLTYRRLFRYLSGLNADLKNNCGIRPVLLKYLDIQYRSLRLIATVRFLFRLNIFTVSLYASAFAARFTVSVRDGVRCDYSFNRFRGISFKYGCRCLVLMRVRLRLIRRFR